FLSDEGNIDIGHRCKRYRNWAVLSQKRGNEEKVIAYFSRSLNRTQRQYCTTRREVLAVVKSLAHFHPYLNGRKFAARTDHFSLRLLVNFKYAEGQLARWLQKIQRYDLKIEHRHGKYYL
ncbi:Retrovirus-related Pol poly from transposon, partial [Paramuricea clavata]